MFYIEPVDVACSYKNLYKLSPIVRHESSNHLIDPYPSI